MKLSKFLLPTIVLTGLASSCLSIASCGGSDQSSSECTVTFQETTGYIFAGGNTSVKVKKGTLFKDVEKPTVKATTGYIWNNEWSLNDNDKIEKDTLVTAVVEKDELVVKVETSTDCSNVLISKTVVLEDIFVTFNVNNSKALLYNDTKIVINSKTYTLESDLITTSLNSESGEVRKYTIKIDGSLVTSKSVTVTLKTADKKQPTKITLNGTKTDIIPNEFVQTTIKFEPADCTEREIDWKSSDETIVATDESLLGYRGGKDVPLNTTKVATLTAQSKTATSISYPFTVNVKRPTPTPKLQSLPVEQSGAYYKWSGSVSSVEANTMYSFTCANITSVMMKKNIWFEFYPMSEQEESYPEFVNSLLDIYGTDQSGNKIQLTRSTDNPDYYIKKSDYKGAFWAYLTDGGITKLANAKSLTVSIFTQCLIDTYGSYYVFNLYSNYNS